MSKTSFKAGLAAGVLGFSFFIFQGIEPAGNNRVMLKLVDRHAGAQSSGKVFNVREFGARGDGVSDDTAAIQRTINAAPDGSTIYFPAGRYDVSNFIVKNRSGLSFQGEERNSVVRQKSGAARIATFEGTSNIVITRLAFDANGIAAYGGVVFYASRAIRLEHNTFIDSAPKPAGAGDHYSFVFGKGSRPSQDIRIANNIIEDLQLEVDHSKDVVIEANTVSRALNTAGIGIFTIGDNAVAEDVLITRNTIIDPPKIGINAGLDPPTSQHCVFRRITISNNRIIRSKISGAGIRLGTPDNSKPTAGNIFEDIVIKDNFIQVDASVARPGPMIFANTSAKAGIVFERLTVTGNTFENNGPLNKGYAIDLRRAQNSLVADNQVKRVANGIALSGGLANELRNNVVEASEGAYRLDGSLGGNKAVNNRTVGTPRQKWTLSNMRASDAIEQ